MKKVPINLPHDNLQEENILDVATSPDAMQFFLAEFGNKYKIKIAQSMKL